MIRPVVALVRARLEVLVGPGWRRTAVAALAGVIGPMISLGAVASPSKLAFVTAVFMSFAPGDVAQRGVGGTGSLDGAGFGPLPGAPASTVHRSLARAVVALLCLVPAVLFLAVRSGLEPAGGVFLRAAGVQWLLVAFAHGAARRLPAIVGRVSTQRLGLVGHLLIAYCGMLWAPWITALAGLAAAVGVAWSDPAPGLSLLDASAGSLRGGPLVYRPHPSLDGEGPMEATFQSPAAAIVSLGRRDAVRLGLRDGVRLGLGALLMLFFLPIFSGHAPLGSWEEIRGAIRHAAIDPIGWFGVQMPLAALVSLSGIRAAVLPSHSAHPEQRSAVLAPFAWLPVRKVEVWTEVAWTTLAGWFALMLGILLPLSPLLIWMRDQVALDFALGWSAALSLGVGLALVGQARGPLRALDGRPVPSDASSLILNYLLVIPLIPLAASGMAFDLLGRPSLPPGLAGVLYGVVVGGGALVWFYRKRNAAYPGLWGS